MDFKRTRLKVSLASLVVLIVWGTYLIYTKQNPSAVSSIVLAVASVASIYSHSETKRASEKA